MPSPHFTPTRQERLRRYMERHPDAALPELRRWSRLDCCVETVSRTLMRLDRGVKNATADGTELSGYERGLNLECLAPRDPERVRSNSPLGRIHSSRLLSLL